MTAKLTVAVLGAGVVGLTTALKILEAGYNVVIIAEIFPGDPLSARYTSNWAGAVSGSMAGDNELLYKLHLDTLKVLRALSEPGSPTAAIVKRTPLFYYYPGPLDPVNAVLPDYRVLKPEELRVGAVSGEHFTAIAIDVPRYLPWLYSQVLLKGGQIVRAQVQHINQVLEGALCDKPDALVVCAGIGARTLGGVEDENIVPIQGQGILIRAPWLKSILGGPGPTGTSYCIPRPSGDVVLGGTHLIDDWYPLPRPETHQAILEGVIRLAPELAPPEVRDSGREPTAEDLKLLIIRAGVGLRPGRKGGLRLERDAVEVPNSGGKKVPIVFNYGHGGSGFEKSWGSSAVAVRLLQEGLKDAARQ